MERFELFLQTSYTPFHAVKNAVEYLVAHGFSPLKEGEVPRAGGAYFVTRGERSIAAFRMGEGPFKIVAAHLDSPCLQLKQNAEQNTNGYMRLNAEQYGGALRYTFFDIPLRIAGRVVRKTENGVKSELYTGGCTVIPSVAIHQNRDANEKFSPDPQADLPLLGLGEQSLSLPEDTLSYDLFAVPDLPVRHVGEREELILSPRLDDLTGAYAALRGVAEGQCRGTCIAVCFDSEEIGSRTLQGAGGDLLAHVLRCIASAQGEDVHALLPRSFLISLDNAHALHPNHPELCDPTNRPVLGGGVAIKRHAGGAYTTDALSAAVLQHIFDRAGVKVQQFYNRSDMRSGSTLGAISLGKVPVPSADIGIAQLAMHSAAETASREDILELFKAIEAFYASGLSMREDGATVE